MNLLDIKKCRLQIALPNKSRVVAMAASAVGHKYLQPDIDNFMRSNAISTSGTGYGSIHDRALVRTGAMGAWHP